MSRHLDKLLASAERHLSSTTAQKPTDALPLYKRFVHIEEHRLRLRHQAGGGGQEVCALRVQFVDVLLRRVYRSARASLENDARTAVTPLAVMAIGGYGRGELNPYSDVDVMFLHDRRGSDVSEYVTEMVQQILYPLWDIGFKVGHSTRSIEETIAHANSDMFSKTALLESRFLDGDEELVRRFRQQFRSECVKGREDEYIAQRMQDQAERHEKFGNSIYMQEPHVKSGCGGLRDYQNLLWMTLFKEGALTTTLLGKDWLSAADARRVSAAYDYLLRVRTDLHYVHGRATDTLHITLQAQIAERLGYRAPTLAQQSEVLMKDYYEHARIIFRTSERVTEQFGRPLATGVHTSSAEQPTRESLGPFYIENGLLHAETRHIFAEDPEQMMSAFVHVQNRRIGVAPELADLLARQSRLVTKTYEYAKSPREAFKEMLGRKGEVSRVLRMMHKVDFLGKYLPEFGQLTCLVQHEFFHRYTADEHTLVCIERLDALTTTEERKLLPYRALFEKLRDPFVLYLALLLHDTGKAVGARPHSEASALFAQRVAKRLQLTSEQRRALILLVDHHVTLSTMAQQRNLDDPTTVVEFAALVKNQENLDALMLLTLVDGQATSADAWSDWKESLVWQLYHATSHYFADQEAFFRQAKIERESVFAAVRGKLPDDYGEEVEAHFEFMPDNYFRAFGVDDIAAHVKLVRSFLEKNFEEAAPPSVLAIDWQSSADKGHTVVSVCTWDREHLLADIAGSFAIVPINILNADIYTRGDSLVLDFFRVRSKSGEPIRDERDIALVESTLRQALRPERLEFAPLLDRARKKIHTPTPPVIFPTRISVDNQAHPSYTLLGVETRDRVGLLHDLLSCLNAAGLYISASRISTEKGAAIDTFYVADMSTRNKVTDAGQLERLRKEIQDAVIRTPRTE